MGDVQPESPVVSEKWELQQRLERIAEPLTGKRKIQFVDDHSICISCRHSIITRRGSQNHRSIRCQMLGPVPHDLTECSSYLGINELSLGQMVEMAMIIDPRDFMKSGYL